MGVNDRREAGRLDFEPDQGVLVVGGRTAVLDAMPPADVVISTYVELVAAQRTVPPTTRDDLRDRELVELARLLDLPAGELDALIDQELVRLLGEESSPAPRRRRTLALGALAVVAAAMAAAAVSGGGAGAADDPEPGSTVETITLSDGGTATRTESAPAPAGDGVDIGTAVVIERNP